MLRRVGFLSCLVGVLAGWSPAVSMAQTISGFGTQDTSTLVIQAWDMQPSSSSDATAVNTLHGHRYLTAGGLFYGAVHLPQGALITSFELESCDTSLNAGVTAILARYPVTGASVALANLFTGTVAADACSTLAVDLAVPEPVANDEFRYIVTAATGAPDGSTTVGAVRIRYRRQVSPSPALATFNDVPTTDPAFQYIEALFAAGATGGCGGGAYCPNAPVTRRQMAVFLAKLLGLHWPSVSAL